MDIQDPLIKCHDIEDLGIPKKDIPNPRSPYIFSKCEKSIPGADEIREDDVDGVVAPRHDKKSHPDDRRQPVERVHDAPSAR